MNPYPTKLPWFHKKKAAFKAAPIFSYPPFLRGPPQAVVSNFLDSLHFLWSPLLHPMDATVTLSTLLNIFATLNIEFMLGVK